jgi:PEGA domain
MECRFIEPDEAVARAEVFRDVLSLEMYEGEHTVSVKKTGFKDWGRKLKLSSGSSVHLSAELEKTVNP